MINDEIVCTYSCFFIINKGGDTKINQDMNVFFGECPDLDSTKVKEFHLLSCVNVHVNDSSEKDYSIHCDTQHQTFSYANEEDRTNTPRYSAVQYFVVDDVDNPLEGQVVGLIHYSLPGNRKRLFVLINRFKDVNEKEFFNRFLPQRIVQYDKRGTKIITDCVPIQNVTAPLFYVPALDKGMDMDLSNKEQPSVEMFYVITQGKVKCNSILSYDDYLGTNNNKFSSNRDLPRPNCLSFNPFLTVSEMEYIKELLNVERNISSYDIDDLEEFDYELSDDDDLLLVEEN